MNETVDNVDNVCKTFNILFTKMSILNFREEMPVFRKKLSTELPNNSQWAVDNDRNVGISDMVSIKGKRWGVNMRVAILGSTGRVGQAFLAEALGDGHHVSLLVRDAKRADEILQQVSNQADSVLGDVRIIEGDARIAGDVHATLAGADVVFSALGTDGENVLSESIPHVIEAMDKTGVTRLVTIGTAGILNSRAEPGRLRYESVESRRTQTRAAKEHRLVWDRLNDTSLDWTIVCPTYLPDGDRTGVYRVEREFLPVDGRSISVGDTAAFAYLQLRDSTYNRVRVGICY